MRLINTGTLHMHQFFHGTIPGYAILSHTWFDDEVTFQEWRQVEDNKNKRPKSSESVKEIERKAGYRKVVEFCTTCSRHPYNLEWAWIDTCCIDKTSSSELSEAINSMFGWYQRAQVCFVYLQDFCISDIPNAQMTREEVRFQRFGDLHPPMRHALMFFHMSPPLFSDNYRVPNRQMSLADSIMEDLHSYINFDSFPGLTSIRWFQRGWT